MKQNTKGYYVCDTNNVGLWFDDEGDFYYAAKTTFFDVRKDAKTARDIAVARLDSRERSTLDKHVKQLLSGARVKRLVTDFES